MITLPKKRARIRRDSYCGYEVQFKRWWWPFWYGGWSNTHATITQAEWYAENKLRPFVKYIENKP